FIISLIVFSILTTSFFVLASVNNPFLLALSLTLLISFFIFIVQMIYPKIYATRKQKNVEKNLIPALTDMLVQLNSGIPPFSIMVNISSSDYGALSAEFKKAIKKINAGYPEGEVLEELGEKNTSVFFR